VHWARQVIQDDVPAPIPQLGAAVVPPDDRPHDPGALRIGGSDVPATSSDQPVHAAQRVSEQPDVRPFFPSGPGHVLVTSRNAQWSTVGHAVEVGVFTRSESRDLLRRRNRELTDSEADELAEALGDLPLAVEQAAAWRAETEMPVEEYLRLFEGNRMRLLDSTPPPGYQLSVAAAWNVSMDRLRTESPGAFDLLNLSVNLRQLGRLADAQQLDQHVHRLYEEVWGADHPFSLAAATNLAVTTSMLDELPEARRLNEQALSRMRVVLGEDHPFTVVSATNLASDLARTGEYPAARNLGLDTLGRARRVLSADHPSTLAVAINLALDLRRLGQPDPAGELQQDTVARLSRVLGQDHPATIAATHSQRASADIDAAQI
jgi:hypothetical protein